MSSMDNLDCWKLLALLIIIVQSLCKQQPRPLLMRVLWQQMKQEDDRGGK